MLKCWLKYLEFYLILVNLKMDLVDILPLVRYWSEVLSFNIKIHLIDLTVKLMDFENKF